MRVLGIDYGEKRIGLALTDPLGMFAQPLSVLERGEKLRQDLRGIAAVCREHEVTEIVIGLPLSMSGEAGTKAKEVREFAARLAETVRLPIHEWDERLTTTAAERALLEGNVRRSRRREIIDKTAAALILAGWLENRRYLTPVAPPAEE